ncbi:protoporphyrinogen oxidase [Candidatus Aerophobetes bacterium]|uniref:Coproporphyrinogen III oxidase n=1 Tax=Aerophobetes bacterium TaxID=2030807 RepID=A0A2A4X4X0_UNCAE|nr:MAG: protoporphyrinogen oxidase [Candidatus Aerophobetes bacterium]
MEKRDIVILGGGISGMAIRFFLSKLAPGREVVVLEKEAKLGGIIGRGKKQNITFGVGPKTFSASRSKHLSSLIDDLGLADSKRFSSSCARTRYIVKNNKLKALPQSLWGFMQDPTYRKWIKPLLSEWRKPALLSDETVWDFALRRFGKEIAANLFDPMTLGIYGGDAKKLSVKACFPFFKEKEALWGSISKYLLCEKKQKGKPKGLFTLKESMMELIEKLETSSSGEIIRSHRIEKIVKTRDGWQVMGGDKSFFAKDLVLALPLDQTASLVGEIEPAVKSFKEQTPLLDIHFSTLCFSKNIFKNYPGFGAIFPTYENSPFLGVIFDKCLFPEQQGNLATVLTREKLTREEHVEKLNQLLGDVEKPLFFSHKEYKKALPQFLLGHGQRVKKLDEVIAEKHRGLTLIGNYLSGVSVEACIDRAYQSALILSK